MIHSEQLCSIDLGTLRCKLVKQHENRQSAPKGVSKKSFILDFWDVKLAGTCLGKRCFRLWGENCQTELKTASHSDQSYLLEQWGINHDHAVSLLHAHCTLVFPDALFICMLDSRRPQDSLLTWRKLFLNLVNLCGVNGLLSVKAKLSSVLALFGQIRFILVVDADHILQQLRIMFRTFRLADTKVGSLTMAASPFALAMVAMCALGKSNSRLLLVRMMLVAAQ